MCAVTEKTMSLLETLSKASQLAVLNLVEELEKNKGNAEDPYLDDEENDYEITIDGKTGEMYVMGTPLLLAPDTTKTPVFNGLRGKMTIPDDFDEPLEEMMEYMY